MNPTGAIETGWGWAHVAGVVYPKQTERHRGGFAAMSEEQRIRHRKLNLERYYAKRNAWVAAGLTTQGKPRLRPWGHLDHLTPEQKRERLLQQKRDWHKRKN